MRLVPGTRLGPYEILAPLGAGGMGEVYRARDTTLEREVAIKILPDALAGDPERLARFAREAKVLASLNHPNIAQIYGVEDRALVMELVPGQTLSERIAEGPVPVEEALRIGAQIAAALAAAHEREVIHRDLKPANVKVTADGRVKVLDFGLAKPFAAVGAAAGSSVETLTATMTQAGAIIGTPGYMSPEQARGLAVDKRTDTWALGCVLYELLTQCRAFRGETLSDVIAAVLEREPAWDALPPSTPQRVRDLLRRCLRKDVQRRARDAGDIALEIEEVLAAPAAEPSALTAAQPRSRSLRAAPFLLAATAIAAALAGGYIQRSLSPSPGASMTRLTALLPPNDRFSVNLCPNVAVSPDGKLVAYIGVHERKSQVFLRAMDSSEATAMPGTEGASDTVFFSPDGLWLGYLQGPPPNVLKKIPVGGGSPVTLATTPGCGGDWGPDDQISLGRIDGIFQIPAGGGTPKPLILADRSKGERGVGFPQLLPGGKAMLLTIQTEQGFQIAAQRLPSGERHILVKGDDPPPTGASARYAPPGFLVYSQADTLMAVPFSVERLELTGPPVAIARGGGQIGSQFSLSRSAETLVYVQWAPGPPGALVWVDRKGAEEAMGTAPGNYSVPRLSPDDRKVALAANSDMWVYDIARRTLARITFGGDNRSPVWTPDGTRITYSKNGAIAWVLADGNSHEEDLWTGKFGLPTSWFPGGERLLFMELENAHLDISVLSMQGERKATPMIRSRFAQGEAVFSPDGSRFAYASDESGHFEIYVQDFPGPGGKVQVSSEGGSEPVWARKGRELFYLSGNKMMAVDIATAPVFQAATPRVLFEGRYNRAGARNYDVTADGQRFVMVKSGGAASPVTQLNVVQNWLGDVRRRAAAK